MQAIINLPPNISSLPHSLSKIGKDIYLDRSSNSFYKLTSLLPLQMFINNDVVTRQNFSLTAFNPVYLAIHILSENKSISVSEIPEYLKLENFSQIADVQDGNILLNKAKLMDFLEKIINRVIQLTQSKGYVKAQKRFELIGDAETMNKEQKEITQDIQELIKRDVPQIFVEEIVHSRFKKSKPMRHIKLDTFHQEAQNQVQKINAKIPKKKPTPKPPQPLPKNQPTLFQFSAKKKQ